MFGLAMLIFSFFVLFILDEINATTVTERKDAASPGACFLIAVVIGVFSEIGLRMVVK